MAVVDNEYKPLSLEEIDDLIAELDVWEIASARWASGRGVDSRPRRLLPIIIRALVQLRAMYE